MNVSQLNVRSEKFDDDDDDEDDDDDDDDNNNNNNNNNNKCSASHCSHPSVYLSGVLATLRFYSDHNLNQSRIL